VFAGPNNGTEKRPKLDWTGNIMNCGLCSIQDGDSDGLDGTPEDEGWTAELMSLTVDKNAAESFWPLMFRQWIMSLVDHFTSVQVLE
jgi:hypothetical protein